MLFLVFLCKASNSLSPPILLHSCRLATTDTMMKLAVLAALAGSASAFAPSTSGVRAVTSLAAKSESLPFLEAPPNLDGGVGDYGFDPFRFSDFVPIDFLREAELKHGRICMMAWLGFVAVDLGFRVYPVPEGFEGLTSVTAHDAAVEQGGMSQMLLWFSLLEIFDTVAVVQMLEGSGRAPGDFGLDGGFLKGKSEKEIETMKLKEIVHCRLAMFAFSGVVTQAVLTQGPFPYV